MNTLYKSEVDSMVEVCLNPFKNLASITMEASNDLTQFCETFSDINLKYMELNNKNIIHNTIYNMEERYEKELNKLYEKFNIRQGRFYDLPEKEREECRIIFHYKPILKMMHDFIGYSADPLINYKCSDPKDNPFVKIIGGYQGLYGSSIKHWHKAIKKYDLEQNKGEIK